MALTNIEVQTMRTICDSLPRIAAALDRIDKTLDKIEYQMPVDPEVLDV